jgi:hypothetical protein
MMKSYKKLLLCLGGAVVFLCGLAVLYFSTPGESWFLPQCMFFRWTGLLCPGCGATRALHALLHGNILAAIRYNVLFLPMILTAAVLLVKPRWAMNPKIVTPIPVIVLLFFILRNLPFYPFTLLAP